MFFEEFNKPFCFNSDKLKGQKAVYICNGSDCSKRGGQFMVRRELQKHFKPEEIGTVNCIGMCQKNFAFQINGKRYSAETPAEIAKIVAESKL
jgi:NADH:ubiquinone oxidoreductase subunit E